MVSILAAMDDPKLFAPQFKGDTWTAWRAFLAALFGLTMDEAALAIFQAQTGRETAPSKAFAEAALIVGRRGGKSRILALTAVFLATMKDYSAYLAPGEVATIAVIAADRKQARAIFRFISGNMAAVPMLKKLIERETDEAIELKNRVVIEIATASFRVTRGYSFAAVLADETAFWRNDESSANPDVEILRALRPGMANIPGAILLLASSPYAKRGALYAAYRRYYGHDDARVLVWKAPTQVMNPQIDRAIIEDAYAEDPEAARAEFGAEFRDDLADFVTREVVDAVTVWGRTELPPEPGITYQAFCDPSGGASDAMALAIGHLKDGQTGVLDFLLEIRAPFNPEYAVAECAAALRRFGVSRITGDRYAGEWPRARFREHGITFEQGARAKSDLYQDLLPLLNARRVELLDHPRLAAQLVNLERRTARSGRDSIDHQPGGHDDLANAAAGVLVGLDLDRRPALVRADNLLDNGAPATMPTLLTDLVAVLAVDDSGSAAVVTAGRTKGFGPLYVLDFDVQPFDAGIYRRIDISLSCLLAPLKYRPQLHIFVPARLLFQARAAGLPCEAIPPVLEDASALSLAAAGQINAGKVKVVESVAAKARTSPFGGALELRAGDRADDVLRTALVQIIAAVLEEASQLQRLHAGMVR